VEGFGLDQPREEVAEDAAGLRDRPAENIYLGCLKQVLTPVSQDDNHEYPQGQLMVRAVDPFRQRRAAAHAGCRVYRLHLSPAPSVFESDEL
jgi:hypothetical protein